MNTTLFDPNPEPDAADFDAQQAFVQTLPLGVGAGLSVVWLVPEAWLPSAGLLLGAALAWAGVQSAAMWWLRSRALAR